MTRIALPLLLSLAMTVVPRGALAVRSAELYTAASYGYGRFEARVRLAAGDGVVSSFFLWKEGSEVPGTFWNELDFEKVGADCRLETNPIYGKPSMNHSQKHALDADLCGAFHVYAFEWAPDHIAWSVDGVEIRRETGAAAMAYAENATAGMQIHFNLWPGDATFGGNFSPSVLPVHEYVDWVQFSAYEGGAFSVTWREEFDGATLPAGWSTGTWASPKNHSTHDARNVSLIDGYAVLSLTTDGAIGPAGAMPEGNAGAAGSGGQGSGSSMGSAGAAPSDRAGQGGESGGGCSLPAGGTSRGGNSAALLGVLGLALTTARRLRCPTSPRGHG